MNGDVGRAIGRWTLPWLWVACAGLLLLVPAACDEPPGGDAGNVGQTIGPGTSPVAGGGGGSGGGNGSQPGAATLDDLLAQLETGDTWDRVAAIESLAQLADPAVVPPVVDALADPSWDVRLAAAMALGNLGDVRAADGLLAMLEEASDAEAIDPADLPAAEEAAGAAADALVAIGPDAVPGIRRAAKDASAAGAARLAAVLGSIGRPALDALADLVRDKRAAVRVAAAESLGSLDADAVPVLLKALKDKNEDVRVAAARSLGAIGSPKATAGLVRLLGDAGATRRAAVGALVTIHRDDATPLVKYLADKDTVQVYRPLIKIGQDSTVTALVKALKKYGTKTMGETYLNCGQPRLEKAAKDWAKAHGYIVVPSGAAGEEAWGVP